MDLLFDDGEDYGDFEAKPVANDVLIGARYYAAHQLPGPQPLYAVLWDMVAAKDLEIYQEGNSLVGAPEVVERVWETARELGYSSYFIASPKHTLIDDHLELQKVGIRAIDVVGLRLLRTRTGTRPYDTIDKVSAAKLQIVGDVAVALVQKRGVGSATRGRAAPSARSVRHRLRPSAVPSYRRLMSSVRAARAAAVALAGAGGPGRTLARHPPGSASRRSPADPDAARRSPAAHRDSILALARPLASNERIDADRATPQELARLPRVGLALAKTIVADREAHGPFGGVEGLDRVPGIGAGLLAAHRPASRVQRSADGSPWHRPTRRPGTQPLDLNLRHRRASSNGCPESGPPGRGTSWPIASGTGLSVGSRTWTGFRGLGQPRWRD